MPFPHWGRGGGQGAGDVERAGYFLSKLTAYLDCRGSVLVTFPTSSRTAMFLLMELFFVPICIFFPHLTSIFSLSSSFFLFSFTFFSFSLPPYHMAQMKLTDIFTPTPHIYTPAKNFIQYTLSIFVTVLSKMTLDCRGKLNSWGVFKIFIPA